MTEPIEVQAEIIEPEVMNLAKAPEPAITYTLPQVTVGNTDEIDAFITGMEKWFADIQIDIYDKDQVKALKDARADINKVADAIDKRRKAMNKEIKAASADAENVLKGMHSRVKAIYESTGKQIERAEDERRQARYNILLREYEDTAPDLMDLIPLDRFTEREPKLMGATWQTTKACSELGKMIAKCVGERDLLRNAGLEFAQDADFTYCQTLDMAKAHERNAQLVKEREAREAHMSASQRLDEAIGRAHKAVASNPEPQPQVQREPEQVNTYRLVFRATKSEAYAIRDFMRTLPNFKGIEFKENPDD